VDTLKRLERRSILIQIKHFIITDVKIADFNGRNEMKKEKETKEELEDVDDEFVDKWYKNQASTC